MSRVIYEAGKGCSLDRSFLVRILGFPATLIHGDPFVLDRWRFLKRRLPVTRGDEKFIDIGCGSGAFTIGAALRGYDSTGLSWDERNQRIATERAALCGAKKISFPIQDVRDLDKRTDFQSVFDVAICFENIEHIVNDRKLMVDIASCLKPGGMLLLSAPYYFSHPMLKQDQGPFRLVDDGNHVRRGYITAMLRELCSDAGLMIEEVTYCSGYLSQMVNRLQRIIRPSSLSWILTFPLRILPVLFDGLIARFTDWPGYSICMVAYKPRFGELKSAQAPAGAVSNERAFEREGV